jgi:hypothetical protein
MRPVQQKAWKILAEIINFAPEIALLSLATKYRGFFSTENALSVI